MQLSSVVITLTGSGFRPNWLSFKFPFTMFDKMGKKVEHHQPHQLSTKHCLTAIQRQQRCLKIVSIFIMVQSKTCNILLLLHYQSLNKSSLTPRQCKAQQSWACWWRPCSAWRTRRWKSGAGGEAAELCGLLGWHRWYYETSERVFSLEGNICAHLQSWQLWWFQRQLA